MRRLIATGTAAVGLIFLSGCHRVFGGDSITWGAQAPIRLTFGDDPTTPDDDILVDGVIGRGLDDSPFFPEGNSLRTVVRDFKGLVDPGGTFFIQDESWGGSYESAAEFVSWTNAYYSDRPDICLVWILPFTAMDAGRDSAVSQAIEDHRGGHRSAVVPWREIVEATGRAGEVVPDGVHPSEEGSFMLAQAMQSAEGTCG